MTSSCVSASSAPGVTPASQQKKIADSAKQFEALLIGQMLKSAQGPDGEGLLGSDNDPGSVLLDMSAEQFAQALADKGGLGIAKMVVNGLEPHANR